MAAPEALLNLSRTWHRRRASGAYLRAEAPDGSSLGMRLASSDEHGAAEVSNWVRQQLPAHDAELIIETMIHGESQRTSPTELGESNTSERFALYRSCPTSPGTGACTGTGEISLL